MFNYFLWQTCIIHPSHTYSIEFVITKAGNLFNLPQIFTLALPNMLYIITSDTLH